MGLIDSHAHLTFPELCNQVDDVLARCAESGVDRVITVGTTPEDSQASVHLAERYPDRIHAAVGVHPHEAEKVSDSDLAHMAGLLTRPGVVAVGEIGLDFYYDNADREVQREVFARQLEIAASVDLPIVIHAREAVDDVIGLLRDHGFAGRRVVFHCFTGTAEEAARVREHGWWISFAGIVTFKKSAWLQAIAKDYPAEELMVETDAPYLTPEPFRGRMPNEPAHVAHVARFLADLRGVAFEDLVEQTEANTRRFFDL
jgi:TatD DNase family protein